MCRADQRVHAFQWLVIAGILSALVGAEKTGGTCWSSSTVYKISSSANLSREINCTEIELVDECHLSFVQKITNKNCSETAHPSQQQPSLAQKYGYGFLAVFIVSILSLAGFVAFPLMRKPYYKYINAFFIALAVGTLFADSAFELFPVILLSAVTSTHIHQHGRTRPSEQTTGQVHVPPFLWQMTVVVLTAYLFYVIELIIHAFMQNRRHHGKTAPDLGHQELSSPEISVLSNRTGSSSSHMHSTVSTNVLPHSTNTLDERQTKSTGWVIIIGDGIHNIADGLAIGAAFAQNTMFGVTTTVAIACHELPTELGEYMVLIQSGFTFRKALLFNFISACTAILGFFIGATVAQNEAARIWIFAVTAGTFAYIALVDLWPTLMPETDKFDWIRFGCVTLGYLSGVCIMFILTIFEERLVQSGEGS